MQVGAEARRAAGQASECLDTAMRGRAAHAPGMPHTALGLSLAALFLLCCAEDGSQAASTEDAEGDERAGLAR